MTIVYHWAWQLSHHITPIRLIRHGLLFGGNPNMIQVRWICKVAGLVEFTDNAIPRSEEYFVVHFRKKLVRHYLHDRLDYTTQLKNAGGNDVYFTRDDLHYHDPIVAKAYEEWVTASVLS